MPTPQQDAIAVLRKNFRGFDPTYDAAADDSELYGDSTGSLTLNALRSSRAGELADRLAADEAAGFVPFEGYVQGEPGRRHRSNASARMSAHRTARQLQGLGADAAADPFTGQAERDRVRAVQDKLDEAATTRRPELTDAANAVATRNAFAQKILKMGQYEAAGSPAALAAATVPFQAASSPAALEAAKVPLYAETSDVGQRAAQDKADRERAALGDKLDYEQKLRMSPSLVPGQMKAGGSAGGIDVGGGFTAPPNMKPLSAQVERQVADMQSVAPLITALEQTLNPNSNQASDLVANHLNWALYKAGLPPRFGDKSQERYQLASLISVAGATPYMRGTRAYQYLQEIQKHLTNPTASDAFLYQNIQELKKQWPRMLQKILQAHYNPGAPMNFDDDLGAPAATEQDLTDPNYGLGR